MYIIFSTVYDFMYIYINMCVCVLGCFGKKVALKIDSKAFL